ncbi:MAG: hypothetical protein JXA60_06785 [Candidatus Coatesbacteria bacterium]|nr:hypothetical protein [Candidatus Coatesbacteria bacterium]
MIFFILSCTASVKNRSLEDIIPANSAAIARISSLSKAKNILEIFIALKPEKLDFDGGVIRELIMLLSKPENGFSQDKPVGLVYLPSGKSIFFFQIEDRKKAESFIKSKKDKNEKSTDNIFKLQGKDIFAAFQDNFLLLSESRPDIASQLALTLPTDFRKAFPSVVKEIKEKIPEFLLYIDIPKAKLKEMENLPFKGKSFLLSVNTQQTDFAFAQLEVEPSPLVNQYTSGSQIEWDISNLLPDSPLVLIRTGIPTAIAENLLPLLIGAKVIKPFSSFAPEIIQKSEGISLALLAPKSGSEGNYTQNMMNLILSGQNMQSVLKNPILNQIVLLIKLKEPDDMQKTLNEIQKLSLKTKDKYDIQIELGGPSKDDPNSVLFSYGSYKGMVSLKDSTLVVKSANQGKSSSRKSLPDKMKGKNIACCLVEVETLTKLSENIPVAGQVLGKIPWKQISGELVQNEARFTLILSGEK